MNPVIKFSTLFGVLAVELAVELERSTSLVLGIGFALVMFFFIWRSFHSMRIASGIKESEPAVAGAGSHETRA